MRCDLCFELEICYLILLLERIENYCYWSHLSIALKIEIECLRHVLHAQIIYKFHNCIQ